MTLKLHLINMFLNRTLHHSFRWVQDDHGAIDYEDCSRCDICNRIGSPCSEWEIAWEVFLHRPLPRWIEGGSQMALSRWWYDYFGEGGSEEGGIFDFERDDSPGRTSL